MKKFNLDEKRIHALRDRAFVRADDGEQLIARLEGGHELSHEELVALFLSEKVPTDRILQVAQKCRGFKSPTIGTFAPLYISNECDAECRMCGMRRSNADLRRETANRETVSSQIDILYRRGLRGMAVLSGEYRHGPGRKEMLGRAADAVRKALARGFQHVLINVGSIDEEEYEELLRDVRLAKDCEASPRITMCTFQETYARSVYAKFMGTAPGNPRSDFERRLTNFDRAHECGMRWANPGLLLGLNPDLPFEILALLDHVRHLLQRGMGVYVSLPRLRKANGVARQAGVGDDELARVVGVIAAGCPEVQVVISTREPPAIQARLLPVIGVLTAGSPGVAPYSETTARFEVEASQFEVADERPFEEILQACLDMGARIYDFEPLGANSTESV